MSKKFYKVGLPPEKGNPDNRIIFVNMSKEGKNYWRVLDPSSNKFKKLYGAAIVPKERGEILMANCKKNAEKYNGQNKKGLEEFVNASLKFADSGLTGEIAQGNYIFYVTLKGFVNIKGPITFYDEK